MRIVHLGDVLNDLFPSGDIWAERAIASLGGDLSETTPAVAAVLGTSGSISTYGADAQTLFILTASALGFGQDVQENTGWWIDLRQITNLDAIVDSASGHQTVEMFLDNGVVLTAQWPEWFSSMLVETLQESILRDSEAVLNEPAEPASTPPAPTPPEEPVAEKPPLFGTGARGGAEINLEETAAGSEVVDLSHTEQDSSEKQEAEPAASIASNLAAGNIPWPQDLVHVSYLKGHPSHARKKKGGTMRFGPSGCSIAAKGLSSWEMHIDWPHVRGITIVGPDEVMFTDQLKVDSNGSAMLLELGDGTELYFEIKNRRPPSLRAELAPLLSMLGAPLFG